MTDRDRFIATILGEPVDRAPYRLFWGPWGMTWRRWIEEGKPEGADHREYFGADQGGFSIPVNCGPSPRRADVILETAADRVTFIDGWGIKRVNFIDHESMSTFLEFPVKTRDDWEAYKAEWLDPRHPERLSGDWVAQTRAAAEKGCYIQLGDFPFVGIFGTLRWLLGDEECLIAFCTMPDLVHDIMTHMTDLYLTVFEAVVREVRVDIIHVWEDMCGRHGPLIGPELWEEFMGPCYRRIKAFLDAHDIPVFSVDTDGNPDLIAQPMINAGVNFLWPMEVAAGCDVNVWRDAYPTLALAGGIDKRALAQGPAAIDAELERICPAISTGRYVPDLDHGIPEDVSWENYCHFARQLKKRIGKA